MNTSTKNEFAARIGLIRHLKTRQLVFLTLLDGIPYSNSEWIIDDEVEVTSSPVEVVTFPSLFLFS